MPLMKSASKEALHKNIETEMKHGKRMDVAMAIAYSTQRRARGRARPANHKKKGGA